MSNRALAFLYSPEIEGLSYPPDCPFKTQRAALTRQRLLSFGLLGGEGRAEVPPRKATRTELEAFHTPAYLDELERAAAGDLTVAGLHMGLAGQTRRCLATCSSTELGLRRRARRRGSAAWQARRTSRSTCWADFTTRWPTAPAGSVISTTSSSPVIDSLPPGKRVAYVDVDAHHGDGVQAVFYRRSDVLTISMHESGKTLYPVGRLRERNRRGPGLGLQRQSSRCRRAHTTRLSWGRSTRVAVPLLRRLRTRRHRAGTGHGHPGRRSAHAPAHDQQRRGRRAQRMHEPRLPGAGRRRRRLPRREHRPRLGPGLAHLSAAKETKMPTASAWAA